MYVPSTTFLIYLIAFRYQTRLIILQNNKELAEVHHKKSFSVIKILFLTFRKIKTIGKWNFCQTARFSFSQQKISDLYFYLIVFFSDFHARGDP